MALIAAAAILMTTVLPAEHGIDPTGIGKMLGLTTLNASDGEVATAPVSEPISESASVNQEMTPAPAAPASGVTVFKSEVPFKSDEMVITLQPGEGTEIKATMRQGEQFVFAWEAMGGKVNFDMHGERPNAGAEYTSYWKDKQQAAAQGMFVAPFDGTHGWYWRNRGDQPVNIKVKVSGFYETLQQAK
ncbi:MAG TPA: hypothetical protein VIN38_13065 [Thiobacillus sp.]